MATSDEPVTFLLGHEKPIGAKKFFEKFLAKWYFILRQILTIPFNLKKYKAISTTKLQISSYDFRLKDNLKV